MLHKRDKKLSIWLDASKNGVKKKQLESPPLQLVSRWVDTEEIEGKKKKSYLVICMQKWIKEEVISKTTSQFGWSVNGKRGDAGIWRRNK